MNTANWIALATSLVAVGSIGVGVHQFRVNSRREAYAAQVAHERAERDIRAASPKLQAELLGGPTPIGSDGFEYRYQVTNTGSTAASDPQGWLVDAHSGEEMVSSFRANASGTRGLLRPDEGPKSACSRHR